MMSTIDHVCGFRSNYDKNETFLIFNDLTIIINL